MFRDACLVVPSRPRRAWLILLVTNLLMRLRNGFAKIHLLSLHPVQRFAHQTFSPARETVSKTSQCLFDLFQRELAKIENRMHAQCDSVSVAVLSMY